MIHYKDLQRFSKGAGYIGPLCRAVNAQATSTRWYAVDCRDCKDALPGRQIVNGRGDVTTIEWVGVDHVRAEPYGYVTYREIDSQWSPA